MATDPLAGITVLDLTNVLAGPFACHQLAHLGADVIKVETVGRGDLARNLGADPALSAQGMGISFLAQNAGKRSLTLNLKRPSRQRSVASVGAPRRCAGREFSPRRDGPAGAGV